MLLFSSPSTKKFFPSGIQIKSLFLELIPAMVMISEKFSHLAVAKVHENTASIIQTGRDPISIIDL